MAEELKALTFLRRRGWTIEFRVRAWRCTRGNHVLFIDGYTGHARYFLYVTETRMVFVDGR
jgi:hypothetical protein